MASIRLPSRTFTASPITRHGMLFIPVPFDLKATFGHGRPPVVVAIGGYSYRSTPSIYGGKPMVPLRREHREVVGAQAGRRLRVTLALDAAPRTIEPPPDLARALRTEGLKQAWAALAPSHQREHAQAILQAKRTETRARRVERAVAMLRARRRG